MHLISCRCRLVTPSHGGSGENAWQTKTWLPTQVSVVTCALPACAAGVEGGGGGVVLHPSGRAPPAAGPEHCRLRRRSQPGAPRHRSPPSPFPPSRHHHLRTPTVACAARSGFPTGMGCACCCVGPSKIFAHEHCLMYDVTRRSVPIWSQPR